MDHLNERIIGSVIHIREVEKDAIDSGVTEKHVTLETKDGPYYLNRHNWPKFREEIERRLSIEGN